MIRYIKTLYKRGSITRQKWNYVLLAYVTISSSLTLTSSRTGWKRIFGYLTRKEAEKAKDFYEKRHKNSRTRIVTRTKWEEMKKKGQSI